MLSHKGIDTRIKNRARKAAIDIAVMHKIDDVVNYITSHERKKTFDTVNKVCTETFRNNGDNYKDLPPELNGLLGNFIFGEKPGSAENSCDDEPKAIESLYTPS